MFKYLNIPIKNFKSRRKTLINKNYYSFNMSITTGDLSIKIALFGIGVVEGILIRHHAPLSADNIIKKLPIILRGRFSFSQKIYWTLPGVEIFKGTNPKSHTNVKTGDIVYNPKTDEIYFMLEDFELPNKVNLVGKVTENLELFLKAKNGLNTKISKS